MAGEPKVEVSDELADALVRIGKPDALLPENEPEEPAPAVEPKKEDETAKPAEGDKKVDEPKEPAAEPSPTATLEEQNRELRQLLRAQQRDTRILQAKLARLEKRSVAATAKVDEDVDDILNPNAKPKGKEPAKEPEEFHPLEILQTELESIVTNKGPVLEILLDTMEVSPKYSDVRDVCSQSNFDDIFEAIGDAVAKRDGVDAGIAALQAEVAVWKMPNPYKYMYDLIKQYHPRYAKPATPPAEKPKGAATPEAAKKPVDAPSSIVPVPSGGTGTGTWTAARIDELPESELDQVPPEIYEKYLRGQLD